MQINDRAKNGDDAQKITIKKEIIRRINCLNKIDNSLVSTNTGLFHNKSIDYNNNFTNKTNDNYFNKNEPKNKAFKTLNNNYILGNPNNFKKITTNRIILNRTINDRNNSKMSFSKELAQSQIYQHSYYCNNNNNKKDISINNNIIININNSNCETLNTSTNKSKSKSKSSNRIKNKKISKSKTRTMKILNNNQNRNKKFFQPKEKEKEDIDLNLYDYEYKNYIKTEHINNRQIPKEYLNIIYHNLLKEEKEGIIPKPLYNYMNNQIEINEQMRSILIDWIIDVHYKFGFTDETLFMTVLIIDRYATIRQISRAKLQLLGITAFMIACKHEEIDLPKIEDFLYITDNAYVKDEMIKMENDILGALNFSLLYPSPIKFFEYLSVNFNFSKKLHFMGKFLMESFLIDIKYIKYKPSVISCACAYITMKFFKIEGYQESYDKKFYLLNENDDLPLGHGVKDCAQDICILVDNIENSKYLSCLKKYSKDEFEKVALIIENK